MVWLVLLTPVGFLVLILSLAFVERSLFGAPGDPVLAGMGGNPGARVARNDQREIHRSGAADHERPVVEPALTRPIEIPFVPEATRPRSGRPLRFPGSSLMLSRVGRIVSVPGAGRQPTVSPKTALDTDNLLPGTVSKIVPGDCLRCGGDLSRGFASARDSSGEDEGGLVCLSCAWLDDAERGSLHQTAEAGTAFDAAADTGATGPADRSA